MADDEKTEDQELAEIEAQLEQLDAEDDVPETSDEEAEIVQAEAEQVEADTEPVDADVVEVHDKDEGDLFPDEAPEPTEANDVEDDSPAPAANAGDRIVVDGEEAVVKIARGQGRVVTTGGDVLLRGEYELA